MPTKSTLALACLLIPLTVAAAQESKVPAWDARGVGPLPRMGVTSIDVSDDGTEIAVGTIAAFGDPNVIILDAKDGKIRRTFKVGQQWIDNVAFLPGSGEVIAICTMPAGKAGDRVEAFLCLPSPLRGRGAGGEGAAAPGDVKPLNLKQDTPWFFHYGNHSNHPTMKLARAKNATAILAGNQVVIYRKDKAPATIRVPISDPDATVSLAVDDTGWAVVGATAHEPSRDRKGAEHNLFLIDPDQKKPVWSRAANKEVEKAPAPEKGLYGTPTLPDGTRHELPQRDEKVYAPLSVAIQRAGSVSDGKRLIAVADYQGWQRWVRSSATMKDDNQGLRFMPTKPTITVYDETGKSLRQFAADKFMAPFWCDLRFSPERDMLRVWPHYWRCRGLAGQPTLPTDEHTDRAYWPNVTNGVVGSWGGPWAYSEIALSDKDELVGSHWDGGLDLGDWVEGPNTGGPALVRFLPNGTNFIAANTNGIVFRFTYKGKRLWQTNLNNEIPKSLKPWVANARATPIVPGVWQIPGGRVESDLGGQRVVEAPDGLILIEGHAGLSFEREWAAMVAVGLDPKKVKYVLATHEHGDHAPGAYLWRVVTGAKFVCSEEMAYTLQHHIPQNTGYGLHPPVPTDIRIKKDETLDLAGLKVKAIRIPGHTAGSMAWHFELPSRERKRPVSFVAFGDLIMPRGVLGYSGSVNFSATDALASLRKLHDLKVDYVLPGHGAVEGPDNYLKAGIDVGSRVGWGFIKPERPDPRFRITKDNVVVVGWGHGATSAAFGDVNGDGKPDVVIVCPLTPGPSPTGGRGEEGGAIVKFFLNHNGKFNDTPDHEIRVSVSQPHKIRVERGKDGPHILVAGKSAAILSPLPPGEGPGVRGKLPGFRVIPFDLGDGNHIRFLDGPLPLVSRRFGGFYAFDTVKQKATLHKFKPDIDGPYADFRMIGTDLLTSYGQLDRRGSDGKFGPKPLLELPREKDWTFLGVGDFNGDGKPDAALLSYGMDKATHARLFYGAGNVDRPFKDKEDAVLPLSALLASAKKKQTFPLVRDTPVVADWNGDGIDDLIVAHGQSDEVLIFLGGKDGLTEKRVVRLPLEYRVHYEHGVYVGDFNGDGKMDLAVFGYTNTGVGASGPPAAYLWLQ